MAAFSRRQRFEILRRDDHRCRYCGVPASRATLVIDHVVPLALGGTSDAWNLVAACEPCNAGKSDMAPDAPKAPPVSTRTLLLASALREVMGANQVMRACADQMFEEFEEIWNSWGWGPTDNRNIVPMDADWRTSLNRFYLLGFNNQQLSWMVRKAMEKESKLPRDKFRFFCGCVWMEFTRMQDEALEAIGEVA